jgi:phospholipid/cholesterol/gamma-HCH transport system ATP-binding protein
MGVEIRVEGLTKRFGRQTIWEDVTLTLPSGEISVLLGPSGTGKSVFLKSLIGLLKPNAGHIYVDGRDITTMKEGQLYETRKLFGVLFQDGALFGSQNLYDNIAFPLREHTKKRESEIKKIVMEKVELLGLLGAETKLPGEISGGMRKRAGLARALVLDPQIILCDEPDSGLDPVRTAFLNQTIVDLNTRIEATFLIVTHDINTARTLPDNIGLLYRRHLAMFGPRLQLLTSAEPVVRQFLNGRREGPIGMAEEKDAALLEQEAASGEKAPDLPPLQPQIRPSDGERRPTQLGPMLARSAPVDDVREILADIVDGKSDGGDLFERDEDGRIIGEDRIPLIVNANRRMAATSDNPAVPAAAPRSSGGGTSTAVLERPTATDDGDDAADGSHRQDSSMDDLLDEPGADQPVDGGVRVVDQRSRPTPIKRTAAQRRPEDSPPVTRRTPGSGER